MRKLIAFTFAAALTFSFAACENQNQETAGTADTTGAVAPTEPAPAAPADTTADATETTEAPADTTPAE